MSRFSNLVQNFKLIFNQQQQLEIQTKAFMDSPFTSLFGGGSSDSGELTGLPFKCVDLISKTVAAQPIYHVDRNSNNINNSEYLKLIAKPNAVMNYSDLAKSTIFNVYTNGAAYWWLQKDGTLQFLTGKEAKPNHEQGAWSRLELTKGDGARTFIAISEVIPFVSLDPEDYKKTLPYILKCMGEIKNDQKAAEHNNYTFENSANPSGVLSIKTPQSPENMERLRQEFKKNYSGTKKAGQTMIFDNDAEYTPLKLNNKDLDFIEGRKFTRDNILALLGVPKPLLFSEDVNLANSKTAQDVFLAFTVAPLYQWFIEKQNQFVETKYPNTKLMGIDLSLKDKVYNLNLATQGLDRWLSTDEARELTGYKIDGTAVGVNGSGKQLIITDATRHKAFVINQLVQKKGSKNIALQLTKQRTQTLKQQEKSFTTKVNGVFSKYIADIGRGINKGVELYDPDTQAMEEDLKKAIYPETKSLTDKAIAALESTLGLTIAANALISIGITTLASNSRSANQITNTFSENLKSAYDQALSEGITDPAKIKEFIKGKFENEKDYKVERIVRTEMIKTYKNASVAGYKSLGITQVKWSVNGEGCPICLPNDGEIRNIGDTFPSGNDSEPAHPNCECITLPVVES